MKDYKLDYKRWGQKPPYYVRKLVKYFRKGKKSFFYRILFTLHKRMHQNEIPWNTEIGPGLYIFHAYGITINCHAKIGKNCALSKNVLIGQELRGTRKGSPTLGDSVYVGLGAAIVGKVTIGNDVLIAPNAFVNCDVPSHSVVFGNPCIIKHKDDATKDYIHFPI